MSKNRQRTQVQTPEAEAPVETDLVPEDEVVDTTDSQVALSQEGNQDYSYIDEAQAQEAAQRASQSGDETQSAVTSSETENKDEQLPVVEGTQTEGDGSVIQGEAGVTTEATEVNEGETESVTQDAEIGSEEQSTAQPELRGRIGHFFVVNEGGLSVESTSLDGSGSPLEDPDAPVVKASYPANMSGDFFRQYDKLSVIGKTLINVIYEHMIVAGPGKALSDEDGARRQASLYHSITGIMNLPRPEFDDAMGLLLGTFLRHPKGAFSPVARLRWMQFIKLTKAERELFSIQMTILPELADGRTRKQIFRQFEKRFEKSLLEASGSTRLTKDAAKNVLAYIRK